MFTLMNASGPFEIVGNELRVKAGAILDFETASSHDIAIVATDADALTRVTAFKIGVVDTDPEILIGTPLADTMRGGTGSDIITALEGDDSLDGGVDMSTDKIDCWKRCGGRYLHRPRRERSRDRGCGPGH